MNRNPSGWPTPSHVKTPDGWAWPNQQLLQGTSNRPTGVSRYLNSAAEEILATAVAWWDTSKYVPNDRFLRNLGYGGSALDARLGSSTIPNTNDPTYLPWQGVNYVFLPDSSSSLTCVAPATAASYVAYRLDGTTATGAVTGGSTFTFSTAGSWTQIDLLDSSSVVVASMNSNTGTFVYASMTTITVAATAIDVTITVASAANIKIGSLIQLNLEQMLVTAIVGSVVTVTRGANGTTAAIQAINSTVAMPAVYTDSFAVEWSLNRPSITTSGGRKKAVFVVRPTFLLGADDFFVVAGRQGAISFSFPANQSFTVLASFITQEPTGAAGYNAGIVSKSAGFGGVGIGINYRFGVNAQFGYTDRTSLSIGIARELGLPYPARNEPITIFGRRARQNLYDIQVNAGFFMRRDAKNTGRLTSAALEPPIGEVGSPLDLNIGSAGGAFNTSSMEFLGAAIFRKPLTPAEMDTISRYYGSL